MLNNLVEEIKKKKEFRGISSEFVSGVLQSFLKKNNISFPQGKREEKLIVKSVRAELRRFTGQYQTSSNGKQREELLKQGKMNELLSTHVSTKERLSFYDELISEINKLNPSSILDLGCGLNPLAIATKKVKYYACDIQEDELKLVSEFFKLNHIPGKSFYCDLRNEINLPKADLCLIFKVFDLLDKKGHAVSKRILSKLTCRNIIVSYSTKKLSGRAMNNPRRYWFEKMLDSLEYSFETKSSDNEIFYFILKRL